MSYFGTYTERFYVRGDAVMQGWLHCSYGNDFYMLGNIVGLVRLRRGAYEAFDLSGEDWFPEDGRYCPLAIGSYAKLEQAKAAVESRFN